jgi:hypothetical protein
LGARQRALTEKRYGVIYADPPGRFLERAAEFSGDPTDLLEIRRRDLGEDEGGMTALQWTPPRGHADFPLLDTSASKVMAI